ncbi:substrate-binding domain-containing protein [Nonomuraea gerenzanensis]|uniref:Molybdopterin biosynthesis protein MoeA / Periplasmic molybdate-binding domain n=1 Tax=Nonomuraea gerenzanensis TaxID=93944 RepID=A0A1M4EDJ7_9ACTN|nr:substrate-binding domain-containing protein [Nonomuraea gerenzanensis]UBU08635.1 GntR family transcriptional regulator [Nonomuraea gerenzanensis]SBO96995.1 Molybdopterin biosynthesis protein MoeA / Periplasmic molybdate-binding domain [Nonomuraea gerenzanensis]
MTRYREICNDLAHRISAGVLHPGDELPGIRELAQQWHTTASTVSRAQRRLADAGVLELADRRRARIAAGAVLAARRFLQSDAVLRLAGSDDPALDLLTGTLDGKLTIVTREGSVTGLSAVRQGHADGAAIHLLHRDGVYNAPFALGMLRGMEPHLIHLWRREQGLIVPRGNPYRITGIADLKDRRISARRPGTGTRILLDRLLLAAGHDPDHLRGPQVGSHLEVALAVATGTVDAGLGVRSAATDLGLDFVSLTWEEFDIALAGHALDSAVHLVAALRTPALRQRIAALGGYDTSRSGDVTKLSAPDAAEARMAGRG